MVHSVMSRSQALVVRDDKVLMVLHNDGIDQWWCLPGGGIHAEEDPSDACIRELFEECKVRGTIIRQTSEILYEHDDTHYTQGNRIKIK